MNRVAVVVPLLFTFACGALDGSHTGPGAPVPPTPPPTQGNGSNCSFGSVFSQNGNCDTTNNPDQSLGTRCRADSNCGTTEVCLHTGFNDSYCFARCTKDSDCGSGTCFMEGSEGVCLSNCSRDEDCPGDLACMTNPGTGSKVCGPDMRGGVCFVNSDCRASGFVCVGSAGYGSGQKGTCTADCRTNQALCGKNTQCITDSGSSACLRACGDDLDCNPEQACSGGACVTRTNNSPRPVGSACTATSQCEQGLDCATHEDGWTQGYCTTMCTSQAECGSYGECIVLSAQESICLQKCYEPGSQSTCRDGYTCSQVTGLNYGVCVPL